MCLLRLLIIMVVVPTVHVCRLLLLQILSSLLLTSSVFFSRGAFVDLLAGLISDVASMYGTPARVLNLDYPFTGRASLPYAKFPAYVGGSMHQYLRVVQLLLRAGIVSLLHPSHVFAVNGVFTVPRSDRFLRFIMDARNTN
eukprot:g62780.t1